MKNTIITLGIALLISMSSFAQQGINYKANLKDVNGNVLAGTFMNVQFTIHQSTAMGTIVYQEDHNYTTDANGLLILNIGTDASPTIGIFSDIDWSIDQHFLQTSITYSGGTVNFDATEFMAVPYAKHAEVADNVFSGNYYDLFNQPQIKIPSGLGEVEEGSDDGWRLISEYASWHGDIGNNAVDLSISITNSETHGATGDFSFASGYNTTASGNRSIAMGHETIASGYASTTIGRSTIASSYGSLAIGHYNTDVTNALFMVGNGGLVTNGIPSRSNALTVLDDGKTGINTANPSSLFEVVHGDVDPTASNRTNALSITNNVINHSWQLHVGNANGSLILFRNGEYRGYFDRSSGTYVQASDRRLKKDITALENGTLNKVMQLNPVSYLMKDQTDTHRNLGLISQEVQELFPSLTHYVKESDLLTLSYTELIPILIKAIQEQQSIIDGQQITIEAQKAKDNVHDKSIETLVARLNLLESKSSH